MYNTKDAKPVICVLAGKYEIAWNTVGNRGTAVETSVEGHLQRNHAVTWSPSQPSLFLPRWTRPTSTEGKTGKQVNHTLSQKAPTYDCEKHLPP